MIQFVSGLSALANRYDLLLCDVWGVVHDGVAAFPAADDALVRYRRGGGRVVLVTNAPRPESSVASQLASFGTSSDAFDAIVTSGDVTRSAIAERGREKVFRLGPDRDLSLFDGLAARPVRLDEAEFVVCTGLFDDETETVADYEQMLRRMRERDLPMICANPDLIVERGGRLIPCAGALAAAYETIGGRVYTGGKPHRPIYEAALGRAAALIGHEPAKHRVLAIGDALRTDIAGGRGFGVDALMIGRGIHAAEMGLDGGKPDRARVEEWLSRQSVQPTAFAPTLSWS